MAFFAVIREGFETAVFLLAAFDASTRPLAAGGGALLGVLVASAIGWGIYRGGVKINLARFFRVTSVVLVLVAAGPAGQRPAHARTRRHGSTGFQDAGLRPRVARRAGQRARGAAHRHARPAARGPSRPRSPAGSLYAIPMLLFVLWPRGLRVPRRRRGKYRMTRIADRAAHSLRRAALPLLAACGGELRRHGRPRAAAAAGEGQAERGRARRDAGCDPGDAQASGRPDDVQGRERGRRARSPSSRCSTATASSARPRTSRRASPARSARRCSPGDYTLYCPGGSSQRARHAEGRRATSRPGRDARLERRRRGLPQRTSSADRKLLVDSPRSSSPRSRPATSPRPRRSTRTARVPYERIEPVAESFGNLDPEIDARVNDVADAAKWTGFHRIEQALWARRARRRARRRSPTSC